MVDFENDIKHCITVLEQGGTLLYPTDTVWGIGCDACNEAAVEKVFAIKQRPKEKSLIVLLAAAQDILQYVSAPHTDLPNILSSFDRPTTVIYNEAKNLPANVVHENGSIAIRITKDPFCKELITRLGRPIISTSANLSGQATPASFQMIDNEIINTVDYVVKYRQEEDKPQQSSRLLRILNDGSLEILRS